MLFQFFCKSFNGEFETMWVNVFVEVEEKWVMNLIKFNHIAQNDVSSLGNDRISSGFVSGPACILHFDIMMSEYINIDRFTGFSNSSDKHLQEYLILLIVASFPGNFLKIGWFPSILPNLTRVLVLQLNEQGVRVGFDG